MIAHSPPTSEVNSSNPGPYVGKQRKAGTKENWKMDL